MSATLSRLNDRGRGFINKHVLKKSAVPARPANPVPPTPVSRQAAPPSRPAVPPPPPAVAQVPVTQGAAASRGRKREQDRFGNDSPEGGLPVEIGAVGNESREGYDAVEASDAPPARPVGTAAAASASSSSSASKSSSASTSSESSGDTSATSSASDEESTSGIAPFAAPIAPPPPGYAAVGAAQLPLGPAYAAAGDIAFDSESSSSSSDESSSEEELLPAEPPKRAAARVEASAGGIMKTKLPPEKYDGEFNKAGWRGTSPEAIARTDNVTRLYTEEEQKQNELTMQPDGAFKKGAASVSAETVGYAMDADGRMVAFNEYERTHVTKHADGPETREVVRDGTPLGPDQRLESTHHSSVLGGDKVTDADGKEMLDATGRPIMRARPAAAAGTVDFDYSGKIKNISNNSGHYMPTVEFLGQAVEHLLIKGAFFKNEVTDANGLTLHPDSKEGILYAEVQKKLSEVADLQNQLATMTAALKAAEDKGRTKRVEQLTADLSRLGMKLEKLTATVDEATAVMRKLGIGPSQRVRDDVTAEFLDIKPGMTGPQIKVADFKKMPAQDFLKSGGGNTAQAQRKGQVGGEVTRPFREQSKERMEELDAKLRNALTNEEAVELGQLTKQWQAARVAAWQENDQQEKQRLRKGLEQRGNELRDAASHGALAKEEDDELRAIDAELRGEEPVAPKPADAPSLSDAEEKRMNELRDKLKGALNKEEAAQLISLKKRSQVAPGIAGANKASEELAERIGGSDAPDLVGLLDKLGIADAEDVPDNVNLGGGGDDDSSSGSEEDSDETSEDESRSRS